MENYIKSINWIFTYKCNLKCKHCDIWENNNNDELSIKQIEDIVRSDIIQKSYKKYWESFDIGISGWEPLLISNIEDIMLTIDNFLPDSIASITTNGFLTEKLVKLLIFWKKKWKTFKKINISIDWNEKNHDKQRWTKWSFKKAIKTISKIKKIFPNQIIEIKLTITEYNYKNIFYISSLASKLWVFFSFKPVENMNNYTNQNSKVDNLFDDEKIEQIAKQIINNPYIEKQNKYINKEFFYKIPKYLKKWYWKEKKQCSIANNSITIMPDWKVFSCILMNQIGNIKKENIENIWNWININNQRNNIKKWLCPNCMLMCWSFKSKNTYEK